MKPDIKDLLDNIETLTFCHQAIADLVAPDADLQKMELDRLALLLDYLNNQQSEAVDALRHAVEGKEGVSCN